MIVKMKLTQRIYAAQRSAARDGGGKCDGHPAFAKATA